MATLLVNLLPLQGVRASGVGIPRMTEGVLHFLPPRGVLALRTLEETLHHIRTVDLAPLFLKANEGRPAAEPWAEPRRMKAGDGNPAPRAADKGKKREARKSEKVCLGNHIAWMRSRMRIKMERFAEDAGISLRYLSRLEAGECEPSVFVLRDICRALGVTIDVIMGEMGETDLFWRQPQEKTVAERAEELAAWRRGKQAEYVAKKREEVKRMKW